MLRVDTHWYLNDNVLISWYDEHNIDYCYWKLLKWRTWIFMLIPLTKFILKNVKIGIILYKNNPTSALCYKREWSFRENKYILLYEYRGNHESKVDYIRKLIVLPNGMTAINVSFSLLVSSPLFFVTRQTVCHLVWLYVGRKPLKLPKTGNYKDLKSRSSETMRPHSERMHSDKSEWIKVRLRSNRSSTKFI